MNRLRVAIVDDEPLARRRLQLALEPMSDLAECVGVAHGRVSALELCRAVRPDVLLLDIAMRDGSGFDVIEQLAIDTAPVIVFVTAFDSYAVAAFEVNAADYLLKPVPRNRLRKALERARGTLATRDAETRAADLLEMVARLRAEGGAASAPTEVAEFWVPRSGGGVTRVVAANIDWVGVEEDYVRLHVGESSHLLRGSIRSLLTRLGPETFVQVHRGTIARLSVIREMISGPNGPEIVLLSGQRLHVGRIYAKTLRARFRGR